MTQKMLAFVFFLISCAGIASGGERTFTFYQPARKGEVRVVEYFKTFDGVRYVAARDFFQYTDNPKRVGVVGNYDGVAIPEVLPIGGGKYAHSIYPPSDEALELVPVAYQLSGETRAMYAFSDESYPSQAPQPYGADDETVGTLPSTAPANPPQVTTTEWKSGAFNIKVETPRNPNEANGAWARRHKEAVEAQALEWPPNAE